jgi:hypothetical protein
MTTHPPYVFISHSSDDNDISLWLDQTLRAAGLDTWFDRHRIRPAARWAQMIDDGVRGCGALLVMLSRKAVRSEWVQREALLALELRKPLFIARLDDVPLPIYLIDRQYSDLRAEREAAAADLIAEIRRSLALPAAPASTLPAPVAGPGESTFFDYVRQLPDGEQAAQVARELYEWAQQQGADVRFGGWSTPVFHARVTVGQASVTVFSVWAYSRVPAVQIPLQYLQNAPPYDDRPLRLSLLDALNRILPEAERLTDDKAEARPGLALAGTLGAPAALADFRQIIREIIDNLRDQ